MHSGERSNENLADETTTANGCCFVEDIIDQAEDLCHIHDHITRIITNLDINDGCFSGYSEPAKQRFDLEQMIRLFLYMYARDMTQSEVERRLRGAAFVYIRLGFDNPVSQQLISYNKRNRFSLNERLILKEAGGVIQRICKEQDVIRTSEPALDPEHVQHDDVGDSEIMDAVKRATELGFSEFSADRANNAKYPLEAYFERQGYLNMVKAGATTKRRRFARVSDREEVPHGSSHNRTMKKIADPEKQLTFDEFSGDCRVPKWQRIRDEVLEPFHAGVENILDELTDDEYSNAGFSEPLHVAIDITNWDFYASPYMSEKEAHRSDKDPLRKTNSGRDVLVDPNYPDSD